MNDRIKKIVHADNLQEVVTMIQRAVLVSLQTHIMINLTPAELQRRVDICCDILEILILDLKWPLIKVNDFLPTYLKCEIDGSKYNPESVGDKWGANVAERIHDVAPTPKIILE